MYYRHTKEYNKALTTIIICMILILTSIITVMATETNCLTPTDDQYLELRAVEVKEVTGQNKQVTMEVWGNNIDFKRI